MDFIDWLASQPVSKGPRGALINDAKAVLRYGGRREFAGRLDRHAGSETVKALREEWEAAVGRR